MVDVESFTNKEECIEYIKKQGDFTLNPDYGTHFYFTYDAMEDEILLLDIVRTYGDHDFMMEMFNPLCSFNNIFRIAVADDEIKDVNKKFEKIFDNPWFEEGLVEGKREGKDRELYAILRELSYMYVN